MTRRCKHQGKRYLRRPVVIYVAAVSEFRGAMAETDICADCGAWLPLGESDETDERARVEIRAATLAADFARGVGIGGHRPDHCTGEHCWHWFEVEHHDDADECCYCGHDGIVLPGIENTCLVGELARCIAEHGGES